MELADDVALRPCEAPADAVPRSEVLVAGAPIGAIVEGTVLEGAVRCAAGRLLFLTFDSVFAESLGIVLVDDAGRIVDDATIATPYADDAFTDLRPDGASTVRFRFKGAWTLRLFGESRIALPWWPDAPGVHRGRRPRRRFALSLEGDR